MDGFCLIKLVLSVPDDLELEGIKVSDGHVGVMKIKRSLEYRKLASALLPQLAFPTKSTASFPESKKNVCFWQRLK
jgi:hypothetical protein